MKKLVSISLLTCLALVSCQISGLTSGYNHLSKQQKEKIIDYNGKIDNISDFTNVYNVTVEQVKEYLCLLYTSPSPRDGLLSRMPSSA